MSVEKKHNGEGGMKAFAISSSGLLVPFLGHSRGTSQLKWLLHITTKKKKKKKDPSSVSLGLARWNL